MFLLAEVWVVLLVVVGVDGAGYVRVRACSRVWVVVLAIVWVVEVACRLTTFACSRVWVGVLAVVWVVWVVGVACWLTTFVVLGWAFWVFEVVGCGGGRRLGRLRCLRVVASRVGEASLGGVRLWVRLWVVGVTRKDV